MNNPNEAPSQQRIFSPAEQMNRRRAVINLLKMFSGTFAIVAGGTASYLANRQPRHTEDPNAGFNQAAWGDSNQIEAGPPVLRGSLYGDASEFAQNQGMPDMTDFLTAMLKIGDQKLMLMIHACPQGSRNEGECVYTGFLQLQSNDEDGYGEKIADIISLGAIEGAGFAIPLKNRAIFDALASETMPDENLPRSREEFQALLQECRNNRVPGEMYNSSPQIVNLVAGVLKRAHEDIQRQDEIESQRSESDPVDTSARN